MRLLLLGLLLLATAAAAPRDWRQTVTQTPAGAFVIGNPAARARLVEYASYTCSHCAAFAGASTPVLQGRLVRGGTTSVEFRHLIRDGLDLGAAILARCTGPKGFFAASEAIFAGQEDWLQRGIEYQQANGARLANYPRAAQLRALADGAGLTRLVQARGLSAAATDRCFADETEVARILAMTQNAPAEVEATPTFFVNGRIAPHVDWSGLEPVLRAQGAR